MGSVLCERAKTLEAVVRDRPTWPARGGTEALHRHAGRHLHGLGHGYDRHRRLLVGDFVERRKAEVRRINLPRTSVNSVGCTVAR